MEPFTTWRPHQRYCGHRERNEKQERKQHPWQGGGGPRDAGWGGQARKRKHIVYSYITDLEELLKKPIKDAGNTYLRKIYYYCGITRKKLLTELEKQDWQQLLLMRTCMFVKACKLNHYTATKQQVATIKYKPKRFAEDPLGITGKNKEPSCLYHIFDAL